MQFHKINFISIETNANSVNFVLPKMNKVLWGILILALVYEVKFKYFDNFP